MIFKPGQLVRHYQIPDLRNGSFRAVLAPSRLIGMVVQIDYKTIGICVAVEAESKWLQLITVLFGDQLVVVSARDLESVDG